MNGAGDAVGETDVELRQGVFLVDGRLRQITDRGGFDHVLDRVALDGFVLLGVSRATKTDGASGKGWEDTRERMEQLAGQSR